MSQSRRFIEVTDYGDVILANFLNFPSTVNYEMDNKKNIFFLFSNFFLLIFF